MAIAIRKGCDMVRTGFSCTPRAIVLSGGPASLTEAAAPRAPDVVFRLGVPVLGICYGMQTMCSQLGGRVTLSEHQEFGRAFIDILDECRLFDGLWPKGGREQDCHAANVVR